LKILNNLIDVFLTDCILPANYSQWLAAVVTNRTLFENLGQMASHFGVVVVEIVAALIVAAVVSYLELLMRPA
jgi:hypothetical protein